MAWCIGDPGTARFACPDIGRQVHDIAGEQFVYLAIRDIGRRGEVLEGILGNVMLVSKDTS